MLRIQLEKILSIKYLILEIFLMLSIFSNRISMITGISNQMQSNAIKEINAPGWIQRKAANRCTGENRQQQERRENIHRADPQ